VKKCILFLLIVGVVNLALGYAGVRASSVMADLFPKVKGWSFKGNPDIYTPDNLFEYINGAAEVFLMYDFEKLATLTYENQAKQSITVEIYRHRDKIFGFGIYAQEKPEKSAFLQIGTQGYYETGVLNFFKGRYYVKISSFDIKKGEEQILKALAADVAAKLDGDKGFPKAIASFPAKGLVANSERYIAKHFLGHRFLHSAFTAEYKIGGKERQIFIIEAENKAEAEKMIKEYQGFAKTKGIAAEAVDGGVRFVDPYYKSSGPMNLKQRGKYLWGLFGEDADKVSFYMKQIEKNLFD
jgi:hypothetical protein